MRFSVSEAYGLPVNAKSLVGSVMANVCGSHYPLHMGTEKALSTSILWLDTSTIAMCNG